jgi:hypothetical protein
MIGWKGDFRRDDTSLPANTSTPAPRTVPVKIQFLKRVAIP